MQNYPDFAVTFLKNSVEKMIFESRTGRYKETSFLAFKPKFTKSKMVRNKLFQVNLTQIKHSLKKTLKKTEIPFLVFLALQAKSICFCELH